MLEFFVRTRFVGGNVQNITFRRTLCWRVGNRLFQKTQTEVKIFLKETSSEKKKVTLSYTGARLGCDSHFLR